MIEVSDFRNQTQIEQEPNGPEYLLEPLGRWPVIVSFAPPMPRLACIRNCVECLEENDDYQAWIGCTQMQHGVESVWFVLFARLDVAERFTVNPAGAPR